MLIMILLLIVICNIANFLYHCQFNPRSPISPENKTHWRDNPEFEHQTHCVVFVVDANAMHTGIPGPFVNKIRELQDAVKRLRK
jgi:hypothetical protein